MFEKDCFSINYHLLAPCNMRCKGCFAHLTPFAKFRFNLDDSISIIDKISDHASSFSKKKITFAGGEPTLINELPVLIKYAKKRGFTTSLITNGYKIDQAYLSRFSGDLDWIGLSVDSLIPDTNMKIGRSVLGKAMGVEEYTQVAECIKAAKIKLKINTVVSSFNADELIFTWIDSIRANRWKVMQCVRIVGENDQYPELFIQDSDFKEFCARNNSKAIVPESADEMIDSYAMIGPSGQIIDNSGNVINHGINIKSISNDDFLFWYMQLGIKLVSRGGIYNWGSS